MNSRAVTANLNRIKKKLLRPPLTAFQKDGPNAQQLRKPNGEQEERPNLATIECLRIFNEQKELQRKAIGRVQKIEVNVLDCKPYPDTKMLMNRHLSTPLDCARHLSDLHTSRSVIARVDGQIWDMGRPLESDCTLTFHHFNDEDSREVNKAFWRSCSFLLGKVISQSFKSEIPFYLHSWPKPDYRAGCFIYDVQLPTLENWKPTEAELLTLTRTFWSLQGRQLPFERLEVPLEIALELFKANPFKVKQLESIREKKPNTNVTLYRVGRFIDFSVGPMIPHTGILGKVTVAAVHPIEASCGRLYRFQGCALPTQLPMHFYAYKILADRAKKISSLPIP